MLIEEYRQVYNNIEDGKYMNKLTIPSDSQNVLDNISFQQKIEKFVEREEEIRQDLQNDLEMAAGITYYQQEVRDTLFSKTWELACDNYDSDITKLLSPNLFYDIVYYYDFLLELVNKCNPTAC